VPGDSFEHVASYFTAALATHISRATGIPVDSQVHFTMESLQDCLSNLELKPMSQSL
jgi:hypothetical protein